MYVCTMCMWSLLEKKGAMTFATCDITEVKSKVFGHATEFCLS